MKNLLSVGIILFLSLSISMVHSQFYGLDYSARRGEGPDGFCPEYEDILQDFVEMKNYTKTIRIYNLYDCNGGYYVAKAAKEVGLDLYLGMQNYPDEILAWEKYLLRNITEEFGTSNILGIAVGCESLFRADVPPQVVADAIWNVKNFTQSLNLTFPFGIGYAENGALWSDSAKPVREAADTFLLNIFPYYDGQWPLYRNDYAAARRIVNNMLNTRRQYPDKKVIIGETGWPTIANHNSTISGLDVQRWVAETMACLCEANDIEMFWFVSHDVLWRSPNPNDIERSWGLWKDDRTLKQPINFTCPDGIKFTSTSTSTSSSSSSSSSTSEESLGIAPIITTSSASPNILLNGFIYFICLFAIWMISNKN